MAEQHAQHAHSHDSHYAHSHDSHYAHSHDSHYAHSHDSHYAHSHDSHHAHSLLARAAIACLTFPILVYRYAVSPFFPSACRFGPSCSAYAYDALKIHGPVKGSLLAIKRLARCHPISWLGGGSGFDPVPKRQP